jgi:hypothetical protein
VKIRLIGPEQKSKTSVAISIAAHVALLSGLAAITFHYKLDVAPPRVAIVEHPVHYVRLTPAAASGGGGAPSKRSQSPTRMTVIAPTSIPVGVPQPVAPKSPVAPIGVAVGARNDPGRASPVTGVEPGVPDSRIVMNPTGAGHLLKTDAQKADSALSAIYDMYLDSVRAAQANPGRAPGDWSWGGKNGDKWGWDNNGIHIGGITIPNAVLAALPLNMGPSGRNMNALTEGRADAYMRSDIQFHANQMSEDDFRSAVKSIRERVDRERQERLARQKKDSLPQ